MIKKRYPDVPLTKLFKYTHSYEYVNTFVQQIGREIKSIEFEGLVMEPIGSNDSELKSYGLTSQDKMPKTIDKVIIKLHP